jgi:hypothetical protein
MDQHGFGPWIRIRIGNTDSDPDNAMKLAKKEKFKFEKRRDVYGNFCF